MSDQAAITGHKNMTSSNTSPGQKQKSNKMQKTYNSRCSLVVTDPTTNLPVGSLSMGERTGSRAFYHLWSYVEDVPHSLVYNDSSYTNTKAGKIQSCLTRVAKVVESSLATKNGLQRKLGHA